MVYCESCMKDDLDYWIELEDGTIVCSEKCEKDWNISIGKSKDEVLKLQKLHNQVLYGVKATNKDMEKLKYENEV